MRTTRPPSPPIVGGGDHSVDAGPSEPGATLPEANEVLAVCAHPDDESFGLGAVLAAFAEQGATVRVLCFTHGEASTLGQTTGPSLGEVRRAEIGAAAEVLGVARVELLSYPDGHLDDVPLAELAALVDDALAGADLVVAFDRDGITGHRDHCHATKAALAAAAKREVPVLGWALPDDVAGQLNREFEAGFVGRPAAELDITIEVDRRRQHSAIECHASQSNDNPVLNRRLELLGGREHLRWLRAQPAPSLT